jgi:MarR family transcriptional regulator, organic hydroperoxide resistance regulator
VPGTGRSKGVLAREAWRELFDFIIATAGHRNNVLRRLGLTPNDSRALGSLEVGPGRTMRSLADEWRCDASTATWIVDRLAKRRLVERRSAPNDRRVTLVSLTARGAKAKAQMLRGVYAPPPELLELSPDDLAGLRDAATKLNHPRRT